MANEKGDKKGDNEPHGADKLVIVAFWIVCLMLGSHERGIESIWGSSNPSSGQYGI